MAEWGTELWDRLDATVAHNKKEIADLEAVFGRFLKDRGEIEKEYAKALRKLVSNYCPKEPKKDSVEEETSQTKAFRLILQETKYQSNQHESLAETLSKNIYSNIQKKVKEFSDTTKKFVKEAKKLGEEKEKSDKLLDKSKLKFQRAFFDWESSEQDYSKADTSNEVSRNQIDKLKKTSTSRQRQCEVYRGDYAKDLIRANKHQQEYYFTSLPTVLNNLQNLEVSRSNFLKEVLREGVKAEKEINPIIVKCLEEIEKCIDEIDPHRDSEIVVLRHKTGNVPPLDYDFEDLQLGIQHQDKYKTLQNKRSRATPPTENLFPKKRELEKKIEAMEAEIQKGQKEISALRLMYETYSQNPTYGDKKNFQGELETATFKVQKSESDLLKLRNELKLIDSKLDSIQSRTPVDTPKSGRRSPSVSERSSVGYGTISNSSNSSEQDTDSLGEKTPPSHVSTAGAGVHGHRGNSWREEDDLTDEFDDFPPPPASLGLARALYDFEGTEESNLSMVEGEEFHLVEADSEGSGWSKVQRMDMSGEGYVPTAFLEWMH